MIKAGRLGHVVMNVSDLKASIAFYTRVVGLEVVSEDSALKIAFLSLGGQHHDIALVERATGVRPEADQPGLVHMAWRLADFAELQAANASGVVASSSERSPSAVGDSLTGLSRLAPHFSRTARRCLLRRLVRRRQVLQAAEVEQTIPLPLSRLAAIRTSS